MNMNMNEKRGRAAIIAAVAVLMLAAVCFVGVGAGSESVSAVDGSETASNSVMTIVITDNEGEVEYTKNGEIYTPSSTIDAISLTKASELANITKIVVNLTSGTINTPLAIVELDQNTGYNGDIEFNMTGGTLENGAYMAYTAGTYKGTWASPVKMGTNVSATISGGEINAAIQPVINYLSLDSYTINVSGSAKIDVIKTAGSNGKIGTELINISGGDVGYITAQRSAVGSITYNITGGNIDYFTIGADIEGANNSKAGDMQTGYVYGNVTVNIASAATVGETIIGGGILDMPVKNANGNTVTDVMTGSVTINAPGKIIKLQNSFYNEDYSKVKILYQYPDVAEYAVNTASGLTPSDFWNGENVFGTSTIASRDLNVTAGTLYLPEGGVYHGKITFGNNGATFVGLTAGEGGITLSQGSLVISGIVTGDLVITPNGEVKLDGVIIDDSGSSLTVNGNVDGKVIIQNLTLNDDATLIIEEKADVVVPEGGKLENNSNAENAISNSGNLSLYTAITGSASSNAITNTSTGTVALAPGVESPVEGGTTTSTTSQGDYLGLNKNLDTDLEIKTGAFLEKDLTINAGVTLTISSGAFLDLNGKTLTVLGNLVVKNGGYITSGGNDGTIVLGKTGSIDNSGVIGRNSDIDVKLPDPSGKDQYSNGYVTLSEVSGIGIGLDKKVNANDVTYTLTLSGDASKKNNVPGTITVTGTVYVDGTLYIGNGITLAGTGTLELKKGATLDLNSKGAVNMNGTIKMNDGSTFNVSGSTTANVSASTGKYVTSQTYTGTKTYTTTVSLTNVIGLVITAESNDYYDDVSEKTITEDRLILSGTVKQGSFVSGSNTAEAGVVITKDGTLDTSITSNKMEYGGVYVVDTLFVDKSVKTFTFTDTKITVLGTVTYEQYTTGTETGDFADTVERALIGAMYSVESTDSYGVKTEKYLIKSFDGAFGDIADAVDQTITVCGPVEVSTEIVLGADQTIEGGAFTITVDGKITVDNDANMTVASMDVQGILVDMADGTFSSSGTFTYSTKSENEAGDITYAGFVVALNNAKPGDVIEISQLTELSSSFTIPAEVTVKVTETGTIEYVDGKVINMTVNGTLINEGTVDINGNTTVNGLVDITEAVSTQLSGTDGTKAVNVTGEIVTTAAISNINAVWYQNDDGEYVYTTLSKAVTAGSAMDVKPRLTQVGTVSDSTAVDLGDMILNVTGTAVFGDIAIGKGAVTVTVDGVLTASITGKTGDEGADTATVDLSKAQKVTVSGTSAPNAQNVQVWSVLVSVTDTATGSPLTGAVTVSDGTVRLGSDMTVSGQNSLTVADGAELVIPDGKILDAQSNSDRKAAVTVNGTMTVNGTLNVNGVMDVYGTLTVANAENHTVTAAVNVNATVTARYVLNIFGTLNIVESEDNGDAQATVYGILAVGSKPTTVGAGAGAVAGPVGFNGTGYIKAYPGADLTAAKIAWNLQNESEAKTSVFSINGAEYMTVYVMESTVSFQAVLTDETFELVGYELSYGNEGEAGYYDITDADSWKADADLTKDLGTNIGSSDAYIKLNASKVPVVISVGTGISLYIDGIKYTTGNTPYLSVGTHTFTVNVDPGYKGDVTVQFNGQTVTGSFTITPEMASAAYEGTVSVSASGNITQDSTVVVDGGSEDGMGLTDYLLIILVVLIVVMAIMVAMRLMRS